MNRVITDNDARILQEMRDDVDRLTDKVDGATGEAVLWNGFGSVVIGSRGSSRARRLFPSSTIRRVRLTQTGGSAGNATTVCSFTYSAFAWSDVAKATPIYTAVALLGRGNRIVAATMTAASYGLGVMDQGTFKLLWCDEVFQQTNCSTGFADAPANLFGTASDQEAGGINGTIFGDSLVTLSAPNSSTVQISTANTSTTGSGTEGTQIVRVLTAGASGGSLFRIMAKATGTTNKGCIRIFRQASGTGTKFWIGQIDVPETRPNGIEDTWEGTWTPPDASNGFILDNGDKVWVSTHVANTFNVSGIAADV